MCTEVTVVLVQSFQRCHIGSIFNHLGEGMMVGEWRYEAVGEGSAGCLVHVDVHGECVMLWVAAV